MESFFDFFAFQNPNVRYVTIGMILLGIASGMVGVFAFLRKRALVGDAVAHSVLPGICLAFILTGSKNLIALFAGAIFTGWLSLIAIDIITSRSRIPADAAIGLVLSVFFGVGIMLLTAIQKTGAAAQAGLENFLFGNAASLVGSDTITLSILCVIVIAVIFLLYKEFKLISFDRDFAVASGFSVRKIEIVLATLTVLAVTIGIQSVGVVLMAAMLITPAAAAFYWTDSLKKMLALASIFGALAGLSGAYISNTAPGMPTGPWVIIAATFIAFFSMFFSPRKGWLMHRLKIRRNKQKILKENILKIFYHLCEQHHDFEKVFSIDELLEKRQIPGSDLQQGLKELENEKLVQRENSKWRVTSNGKERAQRVVKLHRLWELYLSKYLQIAPDHVHEDAEAIEHIITPEMEQQLEELLNYPQKDPHHSKIPYEKS